MIRQAAALSALAAVVAVAAACSDSTRPVRTSVQSTPLDTLRGLIVSQPVTGSGAVSAMVRGRGPRALVGSSVVYVSLVPGSVPTGIRATIRDQANGQSATALVVDGGFDPVPIEAGVGDTLLVDITRGGGQGSVRATELVAARRPPVVIRTSPPSGGRDVPLNSIMIIVFSDPIDSTTLNPATLQLWRDTIAVFGTVRLADSMGVRAEFRPALLTRGTNYRLVVTRSIRDANGDSLDSALQIPFTTTASTTTASPIIAFHSNHGIEEIGADGLGRTVLIADSTAFQPAWSPDGARLAFTRFADGGNGCEIYTVRADGSDERKITTPDTVFMRQTGLSTWCAYFPAWSPDGTKIAFAAGRSGCVEAPYCWSIPGDIYVVNADGSNERQLFTLGSLPPPQYSNFHYVSLTTPMWSPDGSMIAFTGDATNGGDDLWWAYIGTAAGSGARRLNDVGLEGPTWSPDGSQIAGGAGSRGGIDLLNLDGSIAAVLTQSGYDVDPAWSPDGARLVFTRWGTGSGGLGSVTDLFIINRDGTGLQQLTTTGDASHPTWRPATSTNAARLEMSRRSPGSRGAPPGYSIPPGLRPARESRTWRGSIER